MILIDSSVWIDHLRSTDRDLSDLLERGSVLCHPFVLGEMALGSLRSRTGVLTALAELPSTVVARPDEILRFIDLHRLSGLGIGYVDVHLLASARLTPDTQLWTRDKRLRGAAERLELDWHPH